MSLAPQFLIGYIGCKCWASFNTVLSIFSLPQGPVASAATVLSALSPGHGLPPPPPPPPPPGPPLLFENEGSKEQSSPSRSALFAQLNQGEAITKGEKHQLSPGSCFPGGTQVPHSPQ